MRSLDRSEILDADAGRLAFAAREEKVVKPVAMSCGDRQAEQGNLSWIS